MAVLDMPAPRQSIPLPKLTGDETEFDAMSLYEAMLIAREMSRSGETWRVYPVNSTLTFKSAMKRPRNTGEPWAKFVDGSYVRIGEEA